MEQDKSRFRVGKVFISRITPDKAVEKIEEAIKEGRREYICISTARTVNTANSDAAYREVMANSMLNTTDGMPLVWAAKLWGLKDVERTMGPALFNTMLSNGKSYKHFLVGDTDEILAAVSERYSKEYGAQIVGTVSPPFCKVEEFDYEGYAEKINQSDADIVWVSMTAPKQDFFSAKILPLLKNGIVCIGVGAAFRYNLKDYKEPNKLIQKLGLTSFVLRGTKLATIKKWFAIGFGITPCLVDIVVRRIKGIKYYE
ncbi:MAG: WecB/TagA/CpsF family glycosyltransferase [Candidatus Limimorpha sp.]